MCSIVASNATGGCCHLYDDNSVWMLLMHPDSQMRIGVGNELKEVLTPNRLSFLHIKCKPPINIRVALYSIT